MTTNHVQQMKPGDGIYVFFLNAQGRILADAYVLCFEDHFLLDTEPETRQVVYRSSRPLHHCRRCDPRRHHGPDVFVRTGRPQSNRYRRPTAACRRRTIVSRMSGGASLWWRLFPATGSYGVRIYGPIRHKDEAIGDDRRRRAPSPLRSKMPRPCASRTSCPGTAATLRSTRCRRKRSRCTRLHFQKGCYLGQEIVERIRSRGHVNRLLMGFRIEPASAPPLPRRQTDAGRTGRGRSDLFGGDPGRRCTGSPMCGRNGRSRERWRKSKATPRRCFRRATEVRSRARRALPFRPRVFGPTTRRPRAPAAPSIELKTTIETE